MYAHVKTGIHGDQRKILELLELELHVVVNYSVQLRSSAKASVYF